MKKEQINELASRLENAHRLTNAERVALLRDLERYAKADLYGASRLAKDHLHKQADLRLPTVMLAADRIGKHFEERTREPRRPVELYGEQDRQIRQPEDGREYRGPVVGTTPNCLVQLDKDTGDLIVHARTTLNHSFEVTGKEEALAISYPFKAVGGVGLVRDVDHEKQSEMGLQHAHHHARENSHGMEHNR
ncbi:MULTISPECIES: hypothetical protein [Achromobacter]|uniref:HNH endonuclease n=1 Tax=Achromobacter denitrificans TaxID=32002 RepID=A0ABZ3G4K1_ACHDE|nr:hypothetical protein [Achromobacter xylosoxidans]QCS62664.1 hypothetical protein EC609_09060 [Achromobacter denitrificans]